jgi:NDP-sugar pyrophosphorylase family protein
MTNPPEATYVAGIMAAGRGQRLAEIARSKPLALVNSKPLIEHVLGQCKQAGISKVVVVMRTDDDELSEYLKRDCRFHGEIREVRIPPACGTGTAVHALAREIGPTSCLISTADTVAPKGAYRRLLEYVSTLPRGTAGVFLVTSYIHDEDPIWVVTDARGQIRELAKGINPTGIVFANVRWLSADTCSRIASIAVNQGARDMLMMNALIKQTDCDIRAHIENPVFDVDDPSDLEAATRWLQQHGSSSEADRL